MYLVLIAWLYVALMMAAAEAISPIGSWLGAVITFLLYGLLPISVVAYIMGAPARRKAIKAREAAELSTPDGHSKTPGDATSSVGEKN